MASERKKFLKEQIIGKIKNFIENSDISLEELEDSFSELDNMIMDYKDDLTTLQEKIDDKQSNPIRKNRKKSI